MEKTEIALLDKDLRKVKDLHPKSPADVPNDSAYFLIDDEWYKVPQDSLFPAQKGAFFFTAKVEAHGKFETDAGDAAIDEKLIPILMRSGKRTTRKEKKLDV